MKKSVMQITSLLLVLTSATLVGCGPVRESHPALLDGSQVRALFSGNTVESVNLKRKRTSFTYYAADGRVLQQRYWSQRSGRWAINGKGEMCLTFKKTQCRPVVLRDGSYYKLKASKAGEVAVVRYRMFVAGNKLLAPSKAWPPQAEFQP